jgi:hypothetical protein
LEQNAHQQAKSSLNRQTCPASRLAFTLTASAFSCVTMKSSIGWCLFTVFPFNGIWLWVVWRNGSPRIWPSDQKTMPLRQRHSSGQACSLQKPRHLNGFVLKSLTWLRV